MTFSPTEAAFEGFRLTREHPRAVLWWMGVSLLVTLVLDLLMAAMVGPGLTTVAEVMADPINKSDAALAVFPQMALFYVVAAPLLLGFSAVIACAVYRAVLANGPGQDRFGFLRLGADEWRLFRLNLLLLLVFGGVYLGFVFVALMLMGVGAAAGATGGMVAGALAITAMVAGFVYVGVRLSLAGPLSFVEKRISLKDAWMLTRGRFSALLGAFLLSWTLAIVVRLLGVTIFMSIGAALTGKMGSFSAAANRIAETVPAVLTPEHLLIVAATAVLAGLQYAIVLSTTAVAYRDGGPRRELTA